MTEQHALEIAVKAVEIYAARHPRPPHVTITQAAAMLGRSRPTATLLMKRHKVKLNGCGAIAIEDVDRMLVAAK